MGSGKWGRSILGLGQSIWDQGCLNSASAFERVRLWSMQHSLGAIIALIPAGGLQSPPAEKQLPLVAGKKGHLACVMATTSRLIRRVLVLGVWALGTFVSARTNYLLPVWEEENRVGQGIDNGEHIKTRWSFKNHSYCASEAGRSGVGLLFGYVPGNSWENKLNERVTTGNKRQGQAYKRSVAIP